MILGLVVSHLLLAYASGQELASSCPSPNGYFADAFQCDKYYHCVDSVLTEKLCPDGMGFNDLNPTIEKCDFLFQVNCDDRPDLQPARPVENCPRRNGYFPHQDDTNCVQFFYCAGGVSSMITCPESLSFSIKTGTCVWPEEAGRVNCASEKKFNFTCPRVGVNTAGTHPRYADPDDCQFFYVCINGKTPRRNGCSFGMVFNTKTTTCASPKDVPDCADYYTEYFDNYFATLGDNVGGRVSGDIIAAAQASGYPVPKFRERVRIQAGGSAPTQRGTTTPKPTRKPLRRRRPGGGSGGLRRRKRPTTTTTTTTTTPPPEYEYYYYDDYDYENTNDTTVSSSTSSSSTSAP